MLNERTLKLRVEYDGTGLCGWQRQNNGPTIQQHLEEAVDALTNEKNTVLGASRTDAGVHSIGQTCMFKTFRPIPSFNFQRGINSQLPPSIAVHSVSEVDANFHPRFDAQGKHYVYTLLNRKAPSPLRRNTTWHCPQNLCLQTMQESAAYLVGEHDFSAFRASGCGAHTPHRRIHKITIERDVDLVRIEVWGNAFLRNMVRILAGTLVQAGLKKLTPHGVQGILEGKNRKHAGQTAPPQGLCLQEVFYKQ